MLGRWGGVINLALEKERVTKGGKGRGEIEKVTGKVADALTTDNLGKGTHYLMDGRWQLEENCKRSQGSQRAVVLLKKKKNSSFLLDRIFVIFLKY